MSASAPTVFDILLGSYVELGQLEFGIATGGSTSTLVDSGLKGRDDDWNEGTAFLTRDSAGAGAAPEGEFAEVTNYARTTGTLTTSWTAAPASGDEYALAIKLYRLDSMRGLLNRALARMGDIPQFDTSLTTAGGQTEYTIPAAARRNLRRVYMDRFSDTDDTRPMEITAWRQENNSLILRYQPESSKTLTLVYMAPAARIWAASDSLSTFIHINRIVSETAYLAIQSKFRGQEGQDRESVRELNDAKDALEQARKAYPIWDPGTPLKPLVAGRREGRRRNKYGPWLVE